MSLPIDIQRIDRWRSSLHRVRQRLMEARSDAGHWVGELSGSSLSTATAISALATFSRSSQSELVGQGQGAIARGLAYLDAAQKDDGGFGDTDRSPSNIAASYLALAAWHLAANPADRSSSISRLQRYIDAEGGLDGLRGRYGTDKTFVVPILSNCAIAGLLPWSQVPALPFELAALPQRMYRFLRMPVVSYAIPALVAIGQARFHHAGSRNPLAWSARGVTRGRTMAVLRQMQPESGGYLEASPLTSFVVMNLSSMGHADHPVTHSGIQFLLQSQRGDGGWPIDENLATWLTSLSISAIQSDESFDSASEIEPRAIDWLLSCQHRVRHPFTGADPGGWGWTDLSGAVPDADDTPAAMLALASISQCEDVGNVHQAPIRDAAIGGADWLLKLQNRDGGWPTFCRGWGKLPFDRSGSDLTAHAIRALHAWRDLRIDARRIESAIQRGFDYLQKQQRGDGSWLPLWFGDHDDENDENPIYGTAKVILAYQAVGCSHESACQRAMNFLAGAQNPDGGWGGGESLGNWLGEHELPVKTSVDAMPITSSVEETALALEALAGSGREDHRATIIKGADFLCDAVDSGRCEHPWPIGFYFAKLWYHEKLYPLIFATSALSRVVKACRASS